MNEHDLRAVAESYGKIVVHRDRLGAQRRPHAVLTALAETVRYAGMITNVPKTFRDELRFKYAEDGQSAELHWLNTSLRLVIHEEPHWIFPEDYDLDPLYHDFACTRLVAWERVGETERVAGETVFFDNGEVQLTGCFSDQHVDVLTEYHQLVDQLFEWMLKEFRPRVEREYRKGDATSI